MLMINIVIVIYTKNIAGNATNKICAWRKKQRKK